MQEEIKEDNIEQKVASSDNSKALFDLIQNIQAKMNNNESKVANTPQNEAPTEQENNEQPEIMNENKTQTNTSQKNNFDLSALASLLSKVDLSSILSGLGGENKQSNENSTSGGIDPNTIHKFQRVMTSMNKENPQKNLLLSLKPFLRESRQEKLGEYMTMLTVADAIGIFSSKGSD